MLVLGVSLNLGFKFFVLGVYEMFIMIHIFQSNV